MVPVQAIQESDHVTAFTQHGTDGKETNGFDPKIVCCKINNPGIDEENVTLFL
jgi:hypothetical protein